MTIEHISGGDNSWN